MEVHRFGQALERVLAHVLVLVGEATRNGLVRSALDAHAAGLDQLLDALGEDDASTGDGIVRDDDLAHGDADPHLGHDAALEPCVVLGLLGLERQRGGHRV